MEGGDFFISSLRLVRQQIWGFPIRFWVCFPLFSRWFTAVATWKSASTCWICPCTTPATKSLGWWPWANLCLPVPSLRSNSTATCSCSEPVWTWNWYSSTPGKQLFHLWRAVVSKRVKTSVKKTKIDLELRGHESLQSLSRQLHRPDFVWNAKKIRACPISPGVTCTFRVS